MTHAAHCSKTGLASAAFLLLAAATAFGQIQWRSGSAVPSGRTGAEIADVLAQPAAATRPRHVVVQLDRPLTPAMRRQFESAGVSLQGYLGSNAFFASVASGGADRALIERVNALIDARDVQTHWKLHPVFDRGQTPQWAVVPEPENVAPILKGRTWIAAYILFHPDVPLADANAIAVAYDVVVRSELRTVNGMVIELPLDHVDALAAEDAVMYIEPALPPMLELNDSNRTITEADIVQAPPYNLDGSGVTVLVYDGGYARSTHVDFEGRLTARDASGLSSHATHVSGTIGGAGVANAAYRGMAPGVTIESYGFEQVGGLQPGFLYTDPGDLEADYGEAINLYGADISNNSIGTNTAYNGFSCTWEGDYGVTSTVIDAVVRGSLGSPFRIVWANGNERGSGRCGATYHTTAPPACAKNHITVGALNSNDDSVSYFTSWGPADDGRLKPDVSAPGCQVGGDGGVTSCSGASDFSYTTYCGTSMASPTVCGLSSLVLQDYRAQFPALPDPRNSTLKALLAHNAQDIQAVGPDYMSGYGSVRVQRTIDFLRTGNSVEDQVDQGGVFSVLVVVGASDPELKITIAWDDPPGTPNVDPALVNDLDLVVLDPSGAQHFPWTLGGIANPSAPAVRTQADHINNIEQVFVAAPVAGVWTVEVHGFNVPLGPQVFSLCASPGFTGDCNGNGVNDLEDIANGTSTDCNNNLIPDECESTADCNNNGRPDFCDLFDGTSADCNGNGIPDECDADCNGNGEPDDCDIAGGTSLDCNGNGVPDECDIAGGTSLDCNGNGVPDECDIASGTSLDCNGNGVPDECDVTSGASLDCNGNGIPDECETDCNQNGVPDDCDVTGGTSLDCNANLIPDECEPDCNLNGIPDDCDLASGFSRDDNGDGFPDECDTLYVNASATGNNSGADWNNAYISLRDAFDHAAANAGIVGIWIASGTYTPGPDPNDTFAVRAGLGVYGGFAGTETTFDQRDPAASPTVLSGNGSALHVVTISNAAQAPVLDGLTISNGNAGAGTGGGLLIQNASPTVVNCTVQDNNAQSGGGVLVSDGSPTFTDCVFSGNIATSGDGGAVHATTTVPGPQLDFVRCTFDQNRAVQGAVTTGHGGAIFNGVGSTLTVSDSAFTGNFTSHTNPFGNATTGGAITNLTDGAWIENCSFVTGTSNIGGGVYSLGSITFVNGMFSGNRALDAQGCTLNCPGIIPDSRPGLGGAIFCSATVPVSLENCTVAGNWAFKEGGGVSMDGLINNSILWGNVTQPLPPAEDPLPLVRAQVTGAVTYHYSDIEGLFQTIPGQNPPNPADFPTALEVDPLFVLPPVVTPYGGVTIGDVRLQSGSPVIDAGDNVTLPAGVSIDLDGNARLVDDPNTPDTGVGPPPIVDLGAYESPPAACAGDVNDDGAVNLTDLALVLSNFGLSGASRGQGDLDGDGNVSLNDLAELLANFGSDCQPPPIPTYTISGRISFSDATPAVGVNVSLAGPIADAVVTDANGDYTFLAVPGGNYTVMPSDLALYFVPFRAVLALNGADLTGVDFTAEPMPAGQPQGEFQGTISALDPAVGAITIDDGVQPLTVTVYAGTLYNGNVTSYDDLQVGQQAAVIYFTANNLCGEIDAQ